MIHERFMGSAYILQMGQAWMIERRGIYLSRSIWASAIATHVCMSSRKAEWLHLVKNEIMFEV